jgi:hypothetical protein
MKAVRHSPAYVLQVGRCWRVVVPIRGKLVPRMCAEEFASRDEAAAWLSSAAGRDGVSELRERRRPSTAAEPLRVGA